MSGGVGVTAVDVAAIRARCEAAKKAVPQSRHYVRADDYAHDVLYVLDALDVAVAERDKVRRGAQYLSDGIDRMNRMVLDITGLHDLIDEDGDGDWMRVWEALAEAVATAQRLQKEG